MAQLFPRSANAIARGSLIVLVGLILTGGLVLDRAQRSSYVTKQGVVYPQPVPFSHDHHVAQMGIQCMYCHTSVETSASAGIPPTSTCMNCHKLIWNDSEMLEPVRESYRTGDPLEWTRIHDLPDYAYFNHSVHVAKGVGCETCHGRVDQMPLMYQHASLQMEWCLECHRDPGPNLRPRDEIYTMGWERSDAPDESIEYLLAEYDIPEYELPDGRWVQQAPDSCSTCHRCGDGDVRVTRRS